MFRHPFGAVIPVVAVVCGVTGLRILRRTETGTQVLKTLAVRFVPMTGKPKPE